MRNSLRKISTALGLGGREIDFLLVSDAEIKKFNRLYLMHDYPTDVIAFEMREKGVLGDVLISTDTARRQAEEQGHSTLTETKILAIHGLLHLLGYRDKKKKDKSKMWRKTNQLLSLVKNL